MGLIYFGTRFYVDISESEDPF